MLSTVTANADQATRNHGKEAHFHFDSMPRQTSACGLKRLKGSRERQVFTLEIGNGKCADSHHELKGIDHAARIHGPVFVGVNRGWNDLYFRGPEIGCRPS
jgi:hypothetical protein